MEHVLDNAYDGTERMLTLMHQVADDDEQRQAIDATLLVIRALRSHVSELWTAANQLQQAYLAHLMPDGHPDRPTDGPAQLEAATATLLLTRQLFRLADPRVEDPWQWT